MKVSRTVLRGERGSNPSDLPDLIEKILHLTLGGNTMQKWEKYILIIICTVITLGLAIDLDIFNFIPFFLISKVVNFSDFIVVIFQIQSTISTLCIALIALVSSVSNETIYGVSIAQYILQMKPVFLKHKNIITILLLLVLASYLFISFGMYNSVVAALFVTVILIIFMSNEIFNVFQGREQLKSEISNFIKENYLDTKILDILFNDIVSSIDRDEGLKLKENMDLLIIIFSKTIDQFTNNNTLKIKWQVFLKEIFTNSFNKLRTNNMNLAYSYFDDVYRSISKGYARDDEFVLWDEVADAFFNGIKWFVVEELDDLIVFSTIRWNLYKCQYYYNKDGKIDRNNNRIEFILIRIYNNILINNTKASKFKKQDLLRQKTKYFDYIRDGLTYDQNIDAHPVIMNELRLYTKLLIENNEIDVLRKTFFYELKENLDNSIINEELKAYHLSIIIYLYYLSYKEILASDELRTSTSSILKELEQILPDYLLTISFEEPLNSSLVKAIKTNLDWWEIFPENDAKTMVMDQVIDTFLLFYTIYTEKDVVQFKKSILSIISSNVFSFVNGYTGVNKLSALDLYKEFVNVIFNETLEQDVAENEFNRLENVLYEIYKDIQTQAVEIISQNRLVEFEVAMEDKVNNSILPKFQVLDKEDDIDLKEGSYMLSINTSTKFLDSNLVNIGDLAYNHFLFHIINLLMSESHIIRKDIELRDKKALVYLFDLIDEYKVNVNTLIGYKDWYYGYEKEIEFKELESKSNIIKSTKTSNIIIGIDRNNISIKSINCEVKIKDVDCASIIDELDKDINGKHLYNVTNDIYIPFDEDELEKYLITTLKEIQVVIKYKFQFDDSTTGVAIVFQPKKYFERKDAG